MLASAPNIPPPVPPPLTAHPTPHLHQCLLRRSPLPKQQRPALGLDEYRAGLLSQLPGSFRSNFWGSVDLDFYQLVGGQEVSQGPAHVYIMLCILVGFVGDLNIR